MAEQNASELFKALQDSKTGDNASGLLSAIQESKDAQVKFLDLSKVGPDAAKAWNTLLHSVAEYSKNKTEDSENQMQKDAAEVRKYSAEFTNAFVQK